MVITNKGKVYYSFLAESNPYLTSLNKERANEQKEMFLPINNDDSEKDYCEVSKDFIFEYLNHLLTDKKINVSSIIEDIEKLN